MAKNRNNLVLLFLGCLIVGVATGCTDLRTVVADAVVDTQPSPDRKAVALILDQNRIAQIALAIAINPTGGIDNLLSLIDLSIPATVAGDYDFVMFVVDSSLNDVVPPFLADFQPIHYHGIRVFDQGIGVDDFESKDIGPPSLRGYIFLTGPAQIVAGPSLHEIGHAWSVYLTGPPELVEAARPSPFTQLTLNSPRNNNHWNNILVDGAMIGGRVGFDSCDPEQAFSFGFAPLLSDTNRLPFATVELYLMGLAHSDEVEPLAIHPADINVEIENDLQVCFDDDGDAVSVEALAERTRMVTMNEIVEFNGERAPVCGEAPDHFRVALVVLATEQLDEDDWAGYTQAIDFFAADEERNLLDSFPKEDYPNFHEDVSNMLQFRPEYPFLNFFMATQGRATIEFVEFE